MTLSTASNNSSLLKGIDTGNSVGMILSVFGYVPSSKLLWNKTFSILNNTLLWLTKILTSVVSVSNIFVKSSKFLLGIISKLFIFDLNILLT